MRWWAVCVVWMFWVPTVHAEVWRTELGRFPLQSGVQIHYRAHLYADEGTRYTAILELASVTPLGVRFHWLLQTGNGGFAEDQGLRVVWDLNDCHAAAPWWVAADEARDRCELWVGRQAMRELLEEGKTRRYQRDESDEISVLQLEERTTLAVMIDGQLAELPVLRLSAGKHSLWVYDSIENPYILRAEASGVYRWNVESIFIDAKPLPSEDF